jgi:hypothetical protein
VKGKINLNEYQASAPCLITVHSGEILQLQECSDDFSAMHIICSKGFLNTLSSYINERHPFYLDIHNTPVLPLSDEELNSYLKYFTKTKEIISDVENPFRLWIFTQTSYAFHPIYLTTLVKRKTGITATDWIEKYIIGSASPAQIHQYNRSASRRSASFFITNVLWKIF